MTRRTRKRLLKSPVVLVVVFAVALAMTGLVWAHWTDTLEVQGTVRTGDIDPQWTAAWSESDPHRPSHTDDELDSFLRPATEWSSFPTILDFPSGADWTLDDELGVILTTKDVARCYTQLFNEGTTPFDPGDPTQPQDRLEIWIENAYPSYYCEVGFDLHNFGSVPVKLQSVTLGGTDIPIIFVPDGNLPFKAVDPAGDVHLEFGFFTSLIPDQSSGEWPGFFGCGYQLDPSEDHFAWGYFHLEQAAEQNATYQLLLDFEWVNWNEYDPGLCTELLDQ